MKPPKILVLVALTAAALIAQIAVGTASATVLCSEQGTGSPTGSSCPSGKTYAAGTSIHAVISGTSTLTTSFKNIECSESTIAAKTENGGKSGEAIKASVETLSFGKCNCTVTTLKKGSLSVSWISGSHNGTLTSTGTEVTVSCSTIFGTVHCIYATENTDLGTATGGNPSKIDIASANLPRLTTSALCAEQGNWDATYEITSPKPLYYSGAAGSSATETTLTTSLSGEEKSGEEITVKEGSKVKDTATLSGTNASKATGTVNYKVYADKECKELVTSAGEVTVSEGKVPASEEKTLEAGRVYYWQAEYSGDSNNLKSTSTCGKEVLTVVANTSISTSLSGEAKSGEEITVLEGSKAKDTATLSGTKSSTATGKVKFRVYKDKECKELAAEAGEGSLSEGKASSEEKTLAAGAVYYWQAEYPGDSLHQASTSTCGKEILTVKALTSVATSLSGEGKSSETLTIASGSPVADTATLGGTAATTATGTVEYFAYADSECKELVAEAGTVTVTEGIAPMSDEEVLKEEGKYYWRAVYSGDSLHEAASSSCGSEVVTVLAKTTVTTSLSGEGQEGEEIEVTEGAAATDTATLSGSHASEATGTVSYAVYSDSSCEALVAEAGTVAVEGESVPPSSGKTLEPGTYYWQAEYSGDSVNHAAISACGSEIELVRPEITTTLSGEGLSEEEIEVLAGTTVQDQATLHGEHAAEATGTVTYSVYADEECEELVAEAGEVTVEGAEVPPSSEKTLEPGTYYWQAEYSGDEKNPATTSTCGDEISIVVTSASLATSLSGGSEEGAEIKVEEGTAVSDQASLSGSNAATAGGSIEYSVYEDSECKELAAIAGDGTVSEGSVPASEAVTLPIGTYYWQAEYSGDDLNAPATGECGSEVEIVTAPITLTLSGGEQTGPSIEVTEGEPVTGQATLHGEHAAEATGTVEYLVYADDECKELAAEAGKVTVEGAEVPASNEEKLEPGTYYWRAKYSGDTKNPAATSDCGAAELIVIPAEAVKYAALGDSFSAGHGVRVNGGTYYALTDRPIPLIDVNECHRSEEAWPALVATSLYEPAVIAPGEVFKQKPPKFIFRACNGAVLENLWTNPANPKSGEYDEAIEPPLTWFETPAQDSWLTLPGGDPAAVPAANNKIKLVTATIGGNNAGFRVIGENCVAGRRGYSLLGCQYTISGKEATGIPAIEAKLPVVLRHMQASAPNAQIRIPLYPRMLRLVRGRNIPLTPLHRIDNVEVNESKVPSPMGMQDLTAARSLERFLGHLNEAIERTVQETENEGVPVKVIPDTATALNGHRLGNMQPWLNGAVLPEAESFHPNRCGHIAIARAVLLEQGVPMAKWPASC